MTETNETGAATLTGALVKKWAPMLEGINNRTAQDKYTMGVTAMLMENQSKYLQSMNEETKTQNVGSFTKFIFPVLRRVFPNLIANEIVSVQPMTAPVGAVFFLDYVYGTNKGGTQAGNVFPRDFDRDYSGEYINGEQIQTGNVGGDFGGGGATFSATTGFGPVRPLDASRGFSLKIMSVCQIHPASAIPNGLPFSMTLETTKISGPPGYWKSASG